MSRSRSRRNTRWVDEYISGKIYGMGRGRGKMRGGETWKKDKGGEEQREEHLEEDKMERIKF